MEIVSLLTIGKSILDLTKNAKDLFKSFSSKPDADKIEESIDKVTLEFKEYQNRVSLLANQMYQCETLSRFLPMWLVHHDKFNSITNDPSNEQVQLLDTELRRFINDSIHDHFSSEFFRTNYDKLPEIEKMIEDFRKRIKQIDRDLEAIPFNQLVMLKMSWSVSLKSDLFRLRRDAKQIEDAANSKFEEAINELKEVAKG